jgi:hypothetical protein
MPIRLVGPDEPWEKVAQDVQKHIGSKGSRQEVQVGFYGHGAFVKPEALLKHDLPFVAALGLVARMDVMIFPHLPFPEKNPLQDIPQDILQMPLIDLLKNPLEVIEIARNKARQLASESRYATAHATVRLTAGISAFHRQRMTPSLAAFSNSALVIVKMGQLLEHGMISDSYKTIPVAQDVRQSLYVKNVVTFGYPLPYGHVSTALSHRISGAFTNVVPEGFWKQLWGNFPLQGAVENVAVPWAPSHNEWPRLHPQGPEVAALGAFLGRGRARSALPKHSAISPDVLLAYGAAFRLGELAVGIEGIHGQ